MRNVFGWSVIAAVLMCGAAGAQQTVPGAQPAQPGQPVRPGVAQPGLVQPGAQNQTEQYNDQQIAAVIAICNRTEVELVKFALPKLKSDKAKELATAMIKDHSAAADKFGRLAGQVGAVNSGTRREGDDNPGREGNRREGIRRDGDRSDATPTAEPAREGVAGGATTPNNPATRAIAQAPGAPGAAQPAIQPRTAFRPVTGGALNWVALHQEIADEGLANCKKELGKVESDEFDKAFLIGQTMGHMKATTELKVFRRHVSSQLATEIDDALAVTEDHLKQLQKLCEEQKKNQE